MSPYTDEHLNEKILFAFDHMRIEIRHLEWAYHSMDIYRKLIMNEWFN